MTIERPGVAPSAKMGKLIGVQGSLPQTADPQEAQVCDLMEVLFDRYGIDFRSYSLPSLKRRVLKHLKDEKLESIPELQAQVQEDAAITSRLLRAITIHVTAMFRDPNFFITFRNQAIPLLRTYPYLRFWVAGCSSGEEVYSLAILLEEEGLYDRSRIYATDISDRVLDAARAGIFPLAQMQDYTQNYQRAGGHRAFAEYYTADNDHAIFRSSLHRNIVFASHNLAVDSFFNEFHVVFCRNVMIYFNRALQDRVHDLFFNSLLTFGYLGLGRSESTRFTKYERNYEQVQLGEKLFRKIP